MAKLEKKLVRILECEPYKIGDEGGEKSKISNFIKFAL
jgi:hypothetical protein